MVHLQFSLVGELLEHLLSMRYGHGFKYMFICKCNIQLQIWIQYMVLYNGNMWIIYEVIYNQYMIQYKGIIHDMFVALCGQMYKVGYG